MVGCHVLTGAIKNRKILYGADKWQRKRKQRRGDCNPLSQKISPAAMRAYLLKYPALLKGQALRRTRPMIRFWSSGPQRRESEL